MKNLHTVFIKLRQKGKEQYLLLSGCLFFSNLLITAFCLMMYSPTVLNTLPEGGDSRKQVMMIFILVVIGCAAFSVYAAGLFFRHKSREIGIFMALGADKRILSRQLLLELGSLTLTSCSAGLLLGTPLSWIIWTIFRLTLVNTPEMTLIFHFRSYIIPIAFALFSLLALILMLYRFLRRINVLDIIQESHRAEPIRAVPHWYGWAGILFIAIGITLGYTVPSFCVQVLHWYAPSIFLALFYLPALAGLYMVLLHTVVNGWRRGKCRYPHLIATGIMQFQGRQTVRNMLVVTVLIIGAYFAAFYTPMMVASGQLEIHNRPFDYSFFYRADQSMPDKNEIQNLAQSYSVTVKDYVEVPSASLAIDGYAFIEQENSMGATYTEEYQKQLLECRFFSESAWNILTGDHLNLGSGEIASTLNHYGEFDETTLVTNPVTGQMLKVQTLPKPLSSDQLTDCKVLSDEDYTNITDGLTLEWREIQVFFNAKDDNYSFAKELFYEIVKRSGPETALLNSYDRIACNNAHKNGESYFLDPENADLYHFPVIDLNQPDRTDFRMNWLYMPKFRELDKSDFFTTIAVFLLLFIFISILCFAALGVILFTRSMTLILINNWVYQDLRKLGASNEYLRKTANGQIRRIFLPPILTGTIIIIAFYILILVGNGGEGLLTANEWLALIVCLLIVVLISALFYGLYRLTIKKIWRTLKINN